MHPELESLERFYLEARRAVAEGRTSAQQGLAAVAANTAIDATGCVWRVSPQSPPDAARFVVTLPDGSLRNAHPDEFVPAAAGVQTTGPAAAGPHPGPGHLPHPGPGHLPHPGHGYAQPPFAPPATHAGRPVPPAGFAHVASGGPAAAAPGGPASFPAVSPLPADDTGSSPRRARASIDAETAGRSWFAKINGVVERVNQLPRPMIAVVVFVTVLVLFVLFYSLGGGNESPPGTTVEQPVDTTTPAAPAAPIDPGTVPPATAPAAGDPSAPTVPPAAPAG